jgi:hypothetical protein
MIRDAQDLMDDLAQTKFHTTMHGFAQSWSVPVSRSGMWIFSSPHAVSQGMIVVTNNLKHFSNVPGLKVEVWS